MHWWLDYSQLGRLSSNGLGLGADTAVKLNDSCMHACHHDMSFANRIVSIESVHKELHIRLCP